MFCDDRSATCFVMLGCVERLDEAARMHDIIEAALMYDMTRVHWCMR